MNTNKIFSQFIEKLKREKTEQELSKFLADLFQFSATELYLSILLNLTDDDLKAIESIADDKEAEKEMRKRFELRTGFTPEEFVLKLRDEVIKVRVSR